LNKETTYGLVIVLICIGVVFSLAGLQTLISLLILFILSLSPIKISMGNADKELEKILFI